jgi:hypothetical protein
LWDRLGGQDAADAGLALHELADRPKEAMALLKANLKPAVSRTEPAVLRGLLVQLGDAEFAQRQAASERLAALGREVESELHRAHGSTADLEVKRRLGRLLKALDRLTPAQVREVRAVEALERAGTAEARALLKGLAAGAPAAVLTREARAALARLEARRR